MRKLDSSSKEKTKVFTVRTTQIKIDEFKVACDKININTSDVMRALMNKFVVGKVSVDVSDIDSVFKKED